MSYFEILGETAYSAGQLQFWDVQVCQAALRVKTVNVTEQVAACAAILPSMPGKAHGSEEWRQKRKLRHGPRYQTLNQSSKT